MADISTTEESYFDDAYSSLPTLVWSIYGATMLFIFILIAIYAIYKLRDPAYPINCSCGNWVSLISDLKKIYLHAIMHLMDTVSDVAVVAQFYVLMDRELNDPDFNVEGLDMLGLFVGTLLALLMYRLFTAYHLFYVAGGSLILFCLQFLDLGVYLCVYIAWKMDRCSSIFWQVHISHVEALFESIPQIVIQSQFILRSGEFAKIDIDLHSYTDLVIVSIVISFASVVLRFVRSDYVYVHEECRQFMLTTPDGKSKSPYISFGYCGLVLFRGTELLARLACHILMWATLGFQPLVILVVLELTVAQRFLYKTNSRRFLFWNVAIPIECIEPEKRKHIYFRCIENCILMTVVTLYTFMDIPCLQCPSWEVRNAQINPHHITNSIGYTYLIGGWICTLLMPVWWTVIIPKVYEPKKPTPETRREEIMSIPRMFYRKKKCIKPTVTPLHFAVHRGYDCQIKQILEANEVDIDTVRISGATALHSAVRSQNPVIVELLLKYGANTSIEKRPSWYWTCLQPWRICGKVSYEGHTALEIALMKVDKRVEKYGDTSEEAKNARRILAALQDPDSIEPTKDDNGRTDTGVTGLAGDEKVDTDTKDDMELVIVSQSTGVNSTVSSGMVGQSDQDIGLGDFADSPQAVVAEKLDGDC